MKLWHDDVRPAPEGWVHARTNSEAIRQLLTGDVEEASLDHDLGYDGALPLTCEMCGGTGKLESEYSPIPGPCGGCDGDGFQGGDLMYVAGTSEDDGTRLAEWLARHPALIPPKVTIHSWNHAGAERMALLLRGVSSGTVEIIPYRLPRL